MSSTQIRTDAISLERAPKEPVALTSVAVLLHPDDEVAVAKGLRCSPERSSY